jgi:hypothetical protein
MKSAIRHDRASAFLSSAAAVSKNSAENKNISTGQTTESLDLFAGIHQSKKFTAKAAFRLFAGVKRTIKRDNDE